MSEQLEYILTDEAVEYEAVDDLLEAQLDAALMFYNHVLPIIDSDEDQTLAGYREPVVTYLIYAALRRALYNLSSFDRADAKTSIRPELYFAAGRLREARGIYVDLSTPELASTRTAANTRLSHEITVHNSLDAQYQPTWRKLSAVAFSNRSAYGEFGLEQTAFLDHVDENEALFARRPSDLATLFSEGLSLASLPSRSTV